MRLSKFLVLILLLSACASNNGQVSSLEIPTEETQKNILIVVGEGGPSGGLFLLAAKTYQREHGGEITEVHNGDEFVALAKDFVSTHGPIDHMEFFSHGNAVGLFVNQVPGVNGGIYAYDPAELAGFSAASIYELPPDLFVPEGTMTFNGCNLAQGYPEKNSLAQSFSNHFQATVTAPMGPMEFSTDPAGKSKVADMSGLEAGYSGNIYMLPTYEDKGMVEVDPQISAHFPDLYQGQRYFEGAEALLDRGLSLDFSEGFKPYQNITGSEAVAFCQSVFGEACSMDYSSDEPIRNLYALKLLVDAAGVSLKATSPWRNAYIRWGTTAEVLTENFTTRKWFTRGEMSELTWKILKSIEPTVQGT